MPRSSGADLDALFRGHDGLRRWWQELRDFYDELSTEVLEVRALGDQVAVVFPISGRGKGSGILIEGQELTQVFTLSQGKAGFGEVAPDGFEPSTSRL